MSELLGKIKDFPKSCGVYLMKDAAGSILYIGKAKNLKARIQSYFRKESQQRYQIDPSTSLRTGFLMRRVADIDFTVTDTEKEALLLENTLIKKHKPRYNIYFKDDKSYASLKLNARHSFPGIFVTRNIVKDGSFYFGPYASASALRQTVDLITKHFKLRTCSDHEFANRSRPCLEYHIGRCSAPCVGKVSQAAYATQIEEAKLFLQGKQKELVSRLEEKMKRASQEMRYEEAARLRDLITHIEETLEKQKVVHHEGKDYDCIGFALTRSHSVFCVLIIRDGILADRQKFIFARSPNVTQEFLSHFLLQYYGALLEIPSEILLPKGLEDKTTLEEILKDRRGERVILSSPKRGERLKMVALALQNARRWAEVKADDGETLLKNLQAKLKLLQVPRTIECVDISNLFGKEACGSLICFDEGEPIKNRYRRFKIRLTATPNDYAMMYEVLSRRFYRSKEWPPPNLLLVDGGKGQLQIALKALADLGMHAQAVAAIAKASKKEKCDKIYIPGRKNPISFRTNTPELLYLMRIRDEAHRFGLAYHRQLRAKKLT